MRAIGRRVADEDIDALGELKALDDALAAAWKDAVAGLRRNYADREIGERLDITRQAVEQRWPRTRSTPGANQ